MTFSRPHRLARTLVRGSVLCVALASLASARPLQSQDPVVVGTGLRTRIVPRAREAVRGTEDWLWSQRVFAADASFLKVHLVDVDLHPGDVLTLRSGTGKIVETITARGPKDMGTFWSLSARGEELWLELAFARPYRKLPFHIDEVILGDPSMLAVAPPGDWEDVCAPSDFQDVICFQNDAHKWDNVRASVGVMAVGGNPSFSLFCSGVNVSSLGHVLTNDHCLANQSQCNNTEFVFQYWRTGCGIGAPPTLDWESFRCDAVVARSPWSGACETTSSDLDFTLSRVQGDPSATFGHVEVDPTPLTDGEAVYIVQHPGGRPHEITHGSGVNVDVDGTVLRYYDTLDTEDGSSGSPIFREADDKLVGLHHCGGCATPGVGNRGVLMSDVHPIVQNFLCVPQPLVVPRNPVGLEQVWGNDDLVADPGEIWTFRPTVSNAACTETALDVRGRVQLNNSVSTGRITLFESSVSFGDVDPGVTTPSLLGVRFQINLDSPCNGLLSFDLVDVQAANGGPYADGLRVIDLDIGLSPVTSVFHEDFSAGMGDWTIGDFGEGTGPAQTWTLANPGNRSLVLNAPFFIADSAAHTNGLGGGYMMDELLVSPVVDLSDFTNVELQFTHDFNWNSFSLDEQARVSVRSSATGGSWVTVTTFSGQDQSGIFRFDISAQAARRSDVQVRFHYFNAALEWWWAVDDVFLLGQQRSCQTSGVKFVPDGDGHNQI